MISLRTNLAFFTLAWLLLLLPQEAAGDYVVTLKSGRKLTVYSYRAESSHTRLYTIEGEIALPKEQIIDIKEIEASAVVPTPQSKKEEPRKKEEPPLPAPRISPLYIPEEKSSEVPDKNEGKSR